LPKHVLKNVFQRLNNKDRCRVMLVCRNWKEEAELLWERVTLSNYSRIEMLSFERMKRLKSVCIRGLVIRMPPMYHLFPLDDAEFSHINMLEKLETLNLIAVDLSLVDASLLGGLVGRIVNLQVEESIIPDEAMISMFEKLSEGSKLKSICFERMDFECIPEDLFAQVLNSVESLYIAVCQITHFQCEELFEKMAIETKIKWLDYELDMVDDVDSKILAKALNSVEELKLCSSSLFRIGKPLHSRRQEEHIFAQMAKETNLKCLRLVESGDVEYRTVRKQVLAMAINNLEVANLTGTRLRKRQRISILEQAIKSTRLVELEMYVKGISKDLLESVRSKVKKCNFEDGEDEDCEEECENEDKEEVSSLESFSSSDSDSDSEDF